MNARATQLPEDRIIVKGARVHNLKGGDIEVPKRQLVVFTGVSGSGKSSLAFDTLFAEGQRRYVESLSVYSRQFLGRLAKPDVDEIKGLSPTVSIEQKTVSHNPRSTIGTITEIYDHLRVLYAQLGVQHCTGCGEAVGAVTVQTIIESLRQIPEGTRFMVLGPLVRNRKGEFGDLFERLRKSGFTRARIDGEVVRLDEVDKLRRQYRHNIDVVVDRLVMRDPFPERARDAVERAFQIAEGRLVLLFDSGDLEGQERLFSEKSHCIQCDISYPDLSHQTFSFNSPLGMCPGCRGLGTHFAMDPEKVVPDRTLSINGGALHPLVTRYSKAERWQYRVLEAFCDFHAIDRRVPWESLPTEQQKAVFQGATEVEILDVKGRKKPTSIRFEGVMPYLERRYLDAETEAQRERFGQYLSQAVCPECHGSRLRASSAAVLFHGISLPELTAAPVDEVTAQLGGIELQGVEAKIGADLLDEVRNRVAFLQDVGLGYMSLNRPGDTLSGGEAQRVRLARQIGGDLTGVLYVLDEPSIGLHQRDNERLIETLKRLRNGGNSVIVVEHDQETIEAADWIIDFGPAAGAHGGEVTFSGPPPALLAAKGNTTADFVTGRRKIALPETRRKPNRGVLRVRGARSNNLRDLQVDFPLGTLTCVTGVSGAGKSTLVNEILYPAVANHLYKEIREVGLFDRLEGLDAIDKVIQIDQQPIGRTPRSNPATYTKVFDEIRTLFAGLPDAKLYGYSPGRFSFNVAGGRCEACSGTGVQRIEMQFMADTFVSCDECRGQRFNDATRRVRYRGHDIAQVLDMTFSDAAELFEAYPRIHRVLQTVNDVGLGYLRLGQPSPTLSGGEAQRMKLSRELAKVATGRTLYILDEPSTGLHFQDIEKLLAVLNRLVDEGNTVIVIEHNLDIIKVADHVIDIGPEGGKGGGQIVAQGTPEEVAACAASHTGRYLQTVL